MLLLKKENLLIAYSFSSSHNVIYSYISLVCQNEALCGNGLKHIPVSVLLLEAIVISTYLH